MITNERQLRITTAQIKRFEQGIAHAKADGPADEVDPVLHDAMIAGMQSQLHDLRNEVREYQALREGKVKSRELHSLLDVPEALIEGRIVRGFTQKQLAQKLRVPEQVIQRYERTRYSGASIERLQEVADAVELSLRKAVAYWTTSQRSASSRSRRAGRRKPARSFTASKRLKLGGAVSTRKTGKAAASAAGKTLASPSAGKSAKRAAASDLAQVGNRKTTGTAAASAAGKTLRSKGARKPAKRAAASDLSQAGRKKKT